MGARLSEPLHEPESDIHGDPPFRDSLFDVCIAASKGWTRILEDKTFTDAELQTLELLLAEATFHVIRLRTPKDVAF